jgi:mannose-6-phosphate isomerase-like protein (cupin superfamily)
MVRYFDKTDITPCPYGNVRRIFTGGDGIANVHVVSVTRGGEHFHRAYDEVYYFLSGNGTLTLEDKEYPVGAGAVAVIPATTVHCLASDSEIPLEFVIFGSPPMCVEDDRARPVKP